MFSEAKSADSKSTEAQLRDAFQQIRDPELGRSLGELKMLSRVQLIDNTTVAVTMELPTPAYPQPERFATAFQQLLAQKFPDLRLAPVEFTQNVRGKMTGGSIGLRVKNVVAVGSGKGGVGKSTVAATLAYGLKELGCEVGLMDADVYGPSIPHMVGAHGMPVAVNHQLSDGKTVQRIQPVVANGVKIISMAYFVQADQAVIWRGPLLHRAITQFLQDTEWGELDYLIIDLPPGTGDISLTLSQLLSLAGAIVVCTPQQVALLDAVKAVSMFRQVKIPLLGMVENMTGEIFGRGGARQKAEELGIPFLGEIPMEAQIRVQGDAGHISQLFAADSPARPYLLHICQQAAMQIAKQLLEKPSLPTLEIL